MFLVNWFSSIQHIPNPYEIFHQPGPVGHFIYSLLADSAYSSRSLPYCLADFVTIQIVGTRSYPYP